MTMNITYDSLSKDIDEKLSEIIRTGDDDERNIAMTVLYERHKVKVFRMISKKLPDDWVDDVVQETWKDFYRYVRVEPLREEKGVEKLLSTIASRKRATAVDTLKVEKCVENGIPLEDFPIEPADGDDEWSELKQSLRQFIFVKSQISDCQRLIFTLRTYFGYSSAVISRLTGKSITNIDALVSITRKKFSDYYTSKQHYINLAYRELKEHDNKKMLQKTSYIVDILDNPMEPAFKGDANFAEIWKNIRYTDGPYYKFFMVYLYQVESSNNQISDIRNLNVVLIEKGRFPKLRKSLQEIITGQPTGNEIGSARIGSPWYSVKVQNNNISLSPNIKTNLMFDPYVPTGENNADAYLMLHLPRKTVPLQTVAYRHHEFDEMPDDYVQYHDFLLRVSRR